MIEEISAKVILSRVPQPDFWFGLKFNMNLYRGCQHQCIYCDSRSKCYQIEDFSTIQVKVNAIELLEKELIRKRVKGFIGTGSMNDPYIPLEGKFELTRQALPIIAKYQFPAHIITKNKLVTRDLEIIQKINQIYARVSFSISTSDDNLAAMIEPGASKPSERFRAMREIASAGVNTGVILMPVLPFIEDNQKNIREIIEQAKECGASFILPSFGVTLRDRQRTYYYQKLDKHFPGIKKEYLRKFGNLYFAPANDMGTLSNYFSNLCSKYKIPTQIQNLTPKTVNQLNLF